MATARKILSILWGGKPHTEKGGQELVAAVRAVPLDQCLAVAQEIRAAGSTRAWEEAGRNNPQHGSGYRHAVEEGLRGRAGCVPLVECFTGYERQLLDQMLARTPVPA